MASFRHVLTSESVTEGHPDKVCDYISDSILDACLEQDRESHVACETMCKGDKVILAGEITTRAEFDKETLVRQAVREIGYNDPSELFCADTLSLFLLLSRQSPEINTAVTKQDGKKARKKTRPEDQGAGDQGIMFGYATDETPELMPLPILLAHKLAHGLSKDRKKGVVDWLRPDGKTQVSVLYDDGKPIRVEKILVSTQHRASISQAKIAEYVRESLVPKVLGRRWFHDGIKVLVNPSGSFAIGGPTADAGLTGRKIIVDTYGGAAHHGGGAFSGKDPSKVDRSGAYFGRFVARQIVLKGLAHRAEIQVSYAIGQAEPMSVKVDTFGTGNPQTAEKFVRENFDFRPAMMIKQLKLKQPFYRKTTNYGHFGRPGLPWED